MKKYKLLAMICVIVLIAGVALVGCTGGGTTPPAQQEEEEEEEEEEVLYELTFGVWDPPEIPMMRVVQTSWAKSLEDKSGGRLRITFLYSETVAKAPELADACAQGLCDMAWTAPGIFAPMRYRVNELTTLPLLFKFPGSLTASLTMVELYNKYQSYFDSEYEGLHIFGFHHNGPSNINTLDKPIYTMEDLKGLIINSMTPEMAAELGCVSESVLPGEAYDALAKGVVDGTLHEYEGHYVWNHYELCKYTTEVGLNVTACFTHVMNLNTWNSLPPDLQALFEGDNFDLISYVNGFNFDGDDIYDKQLIYENRIGRDIPDGGIYVLPDDERQRWIDACMPLREQWVQDANDRGAPGQDMLDDCVMWAEQYRVPREDNCPWCYDWFIDWYGPGYADIYEATTS